ncbi:LysR substrate-binding domain-containing protein [Bordetella sp. BOR01]|uniref:LysR substrate-binding domain-containing protein n=1 Tax=Bordetella sp. BOR01 TaxID=2854779 RepID=UPI001C4422B8|nr:LysR substrate-binding domain-containing protein [Bordetella sp. BOR01]MBV7485579.1 LysR family transcriptional regulator [Bordetella sp. BOR01]
MSGLHPSQPDAWSVSRSAAYRLDRVRLRHLRLLEVIDREGSLGAAARELGISQPAVTLLLRELEDVFGARLVERDARGGRLTMAGRHARDRLVIAMATVNAAIGAAQQPAGAPMLRVGCVQLVGFSSLPQALARLLAQDALPYMHIEEAEAVTLIAALAAGELDCVIGWLDETIASTVNLDRIHVEPLWSGRMQVFASAAHPLATRKQVRMAELAGCPWVVPHRGSRTYAAFQRLFLNSGLAAPRPQLVCTSIHTGVHMVAAGPFVSIGPDRLIARYRDSHGIRALRGGELDTGRTQLSFFTLKEAAGFEPAMRLKQALLRTRPDESGYPLADGA